MSDFSIELDLDMDSLQSIFGQHDSYIAKIEKQLHVTVVNRTAVQRSSEKKEMRSVRRS